MFTLCIFILLHGTSANCANVLISADYGAGSHFFAASGVGKALINRGHNVTLLLGAAYAHRAENPNYASFHFVVFDHVDTVQDIRNRYDSIGQIAFDTPVVQLTKYFEIFDEGYINDCAKLLKDDGILSQLKHGNYDMVLFDPVWWCGILIAEKLGKIPVIGMSQITAISLLLDISGNSYNPSYVPQFSSGFTPKMTFLQRVWNTWFTTLFHLTMPMAFIGYDELMATHGLYPEGKTLMHYMQNEVQLWLVNVDFAVEFPISLAPNIIPVGGLTTKLPNYLSEELEDFMQSSGDDGVIVFTLGSYFTLGKYMTPIHLDFVKIFVDAFAQLDQKVVWHVKEVEKLLMKLPPNVKTMEWIPQNDLLGHNKTRVFMYHGGNNGLYEALYHGVATIVIPIMGDQYDVGARIQNSGMGLRIDKFTLSTEKVLDAVREILTKDKYRKTAKRLSAVFHDQPMSPQERAAFWVEHIIKHGGKHLRSTYNNLNFIQRHLLDVIAFLALCLVAVTFLLGLVSRWVIRCVRRCREFGSKSKRD